MVVLRSLKDILSIKIKPRHDSASDQFNRLFMTKMLLVAAFLMGFEYFSDKITCLKPPNSNLPAGFIHSACWISGFFVYKEISGVEHTTNTIYYGIPKTFNLDGHFTIKPQYRDSVNIPRRLSSQTGGLCQMKIDSSKDSNIPYYLQCESMTRDYYLHYQWMAFYMGVLAVLFYLPYIGYRLANADLISLKNVLQSVTGDADHIVRNYFNYKINSIGKLRLRVMLNIFVKCCYVAVNLFAFFFTDYLLNGNYANYGFEYLQWARQDTAAKKHDNRRMRRMERPGNQLLPSMGICEIEETSLNAATMTFNSHLLLCEISTHVLFQYVLIVLWFLFVVSITISIAGLMLQLSGYAMSSILGSLGGGEGINCVYMGRSSPKKIICRVLTLRESEYLQFIKKKDMVMYGEVLRKLKQQRTDLQGKIAHEDFENSNGFV